MLTKRYFWTVDGNLPFIEIAYGNYVYLNPTQGFANEDEALTGLEEFCAKYKQMAHQRYTLDETFLYDWN